jgi:hypothetical protein
MPFKSVLLKPSFELKNHVSFNLSVVHFRCLIDPDFAPLVVQLSEIELIRSIDKVQCISCYSVALLLTLSSQFRNQGSRGRILSP